MSTQQQYILALDLGTTGNRAILFDHEGQVASQAYKELTQYYPQPGWLEHNPLEIWQDTYACIQQATQKLGIAFGQIAAIGLTVQRETCLLWDKTTGQPIHRAIVWQDRRTAPLCETLRAQGKAPLIQEKTGLVLDAYFSATKFAWLGDRLRQEQPHLHWDNVLAGTVDSWILWRLTGGQVHGTDHSNASRTMLMNLESRTWDPELLSLFQIRQEMMPEILPSIGHFGHTTEKLFGVEIPITAIFGDQQAALFAHGCDRPGLLKCTYGTGSFLVAQGGETIVKSQNQLLSTVAWSQGTTAKYALEGAIFTSGACIQWLRDGLQLIQHAADTEAIAQEVDNTNGVYFVPALSGLGAPHWDMGARGAFLGLTGGVKRAHLVRAVLEAIAYQVKEVVDAMDRDSHQPIQLLKVDGGAAQNNWLMQFQADALGIPLERPAVLDATAQGAAFGAGLGVGFWESYGNLIAKRQVDRIFEPGAGQPSAQENFPRWQEAVKRAKHWV